MAGGSVAKAFLVLLISSISQAGYGYGGHRDCTPGYDRDCSLPITFTDSALSQSSSPQRPQPQEGGALPAQPSRSSAKPQQHEGLTIEEGSPSDSVAKDECKLDIPDDCKFPFSYKDQQYSACTDADAVGTKWCSTQKTYKGSWRECKSTCKDKWPIKSIVGTAVAGGVAAAGLGMAVAATELTRQKKLGSQATIPAGTAALDTKLDMETRSTTLSFAPVAAARFLDKQNSNAQVPAERAAPQLATVAALPNRGWLWVVAFFSVAVCCSVCVSGIVALCLAKSERPGKYMQIDDEEGNDDHPDLYVE